MKGIFFEFRMTKTNYPRAKSCDKTRFPQETLEVILYNLGGEQNPARFKIMEVSVW